MRVLLGSDSERAGAILRESLIQGKLCSEARVLSLGGLLNGLAQYRPDAVILRLPQNRETVLSVIRDIRETMPTRTMVVGPAVEAKFILKILGAGAFHYIDEDDLETDLRSALTRLRSEPPLQSEFGRVISVIGAGGGTGATTLAVNIGTGLAHGQPRCALLDLKLEAGDAATLLDLRPKHSLADFCRNADRMDQAMFEQCLTQHSSGICLLAAPRSLPDIKEVNARVLRKAIHMLRMTYPYVVVDLDRSLRCDTAQVLFQSDIVLVVMRLDFTSVNQCQRLLDQLRELQVSNDNVRVVVNRFRRPGELRVPDVEKVLGVPVCQFVPDDARRVNRANNRGVPVVLGYPRAAVSKGLLSLAKSVNGHAKSADWVGLPPN